MQTQICRRKLFAGRRPFAAEQTVAGQRFPPDPSAAWFPARCSARLHWDLPPFPQISQRPGFWLVVPPNRLHGLVWKIKRPPCADLIMLPDALPQLVDTLLRLRPLEAAQLRELIQHLPDPQ